MTPSSKLSSHWQESHSLPAPSGWAILALTVAAVFLCLVVGGCVAHVVGWAS
jgi:hypothetical protein